MSPQTRSGLPLVLSHLFPAGRAAESGSGRADAESAVRGALLSHGALHLGLSVQGGASAALRLQLLLLAPLPVLGNTGEISRNSPFLKLSASPVPWTREPRRGDLETLRGGGTWVSLSVQNLVPPPPEKRV